MSHPSSDTEALTGSEGTAKKSGATDIPEEIAIQIPLLHQEQRSGAHAFAGAPERWSDTDSRHTDPFESRGCGGENPCGLEDGNG